MKTWEQFSDLDDRAEERRARRIRENGEYSSQLDFPSEAQLIESWRAAA